MIKFQKDFVLKETCNEVPNTQQCEQIWVKYVRSSKYQELKNFATKLCTMFDSTYVCEDVFSKIHFIKKHLQISVMRKIF